MKRATRNLLVGGCALVLALELPTALAAFVAGLRGPYAPERVEDDASARLPSEVRNLVGLLFLVRP